LQPPVKHAFLQVGKLSGMGNAAGSFERQLLISYLDEEIMVSAATISHYNLNMFLLHLIFHIYFTHKTSWNLEASQFERYKLSVFGQQIMLGKRQII
jgi:hypothetical protein